MKRKLPNFLIVGAPKCGTSSLHSYLNQHSDIFMPTFNKEGMKVKEPRFLIKDIVESRLQKGVWNWDEYQALFDEAGNQSALGEATVLYLYFYNHAIKNIKKYLGEEVKIIIMLRNPIDRAYSAYSFASRTIQENKSFKEAIDSAMIRYKNNKFVSPMILYKELGLYAKMVEAYQKNFSNVHIILFDDFISDASEEVKKVFKFLGVTNEEVNTSEVINAGGKRWKSSLIKRVIMGDNKLKRVFKILFPNNFRFYMKEFIKKLFTAKAGEIDDLVKYELRAYFKDDILKLERLIDRDLSIWQK